MKKGGRRTVCVFDDLQLFVLQPWLNLIKESEIRRLLQPLLNMYLMKNNEDNAMSLGSASAGKVIPTI